MSNMKIWDALSKTDPAHTKGFKRAGGFSGTALKPMWMVKRLTEQFGPIGEGWGMNEPQFNVVNGADGEVLVYCTVTCWHTDKVNTFCGVGGDKVISKNKHGLFSDDEAFKKAFTDAVGNAFKFVGVGADIHMGQFDDSKYVQQMEKEFAPKVENITDAQREELMLLCKGLNFPVDRVLTAKKIADLSDLPATSFKGAMKWIGDEAKKMENNNA